MKKQKLSDVIAKLEKDAITVRLASQSKQLRKLIDLDVAVQLLKDALQGNIVGD